MDAFTEASRVQFLARLCTLVRSELPELALLSKAELGALAERALTRGEAAGIVTERGSAELALLACSWWAITGGIELPDWFEGVLKRSDVDEEGKLRQLTERSRNEVLAYAEIAKE